MKRFPFITLCAVIFAAALLCVKPHSVFAQQSAPYEWRQIRVHNVRSGMMAYFIDPQNQKEPPELKYPSLDNSDYSSQDFINAMTSGAPALHFNGVLAVDDKQNALWILSYQDTFDQTKRFVDFMDRPISQCELEAQIVRVNQEDLKSLETKPIQAVLKNHAGQLRYKFRALATNSQVKLFATLQATLSKLVQQGKAKIINSPRLTTLNHSTGSLSSATTTPTSVAVKDFTRDKNPPYAPLAFDSTDGYQIGRTTQLRAAFTPNINEAANTISLDLNISADEGLSKYEALPKDSSSSHDQTIWFRNQVNPPLIARVNMEDNQTILITGLDTTLLGFDEKHDNVAVFLTARIIHRSEG
jgi:type II secretory pathway component GspD/PulD (secretin)